MVLLGRETICRDGEHLGPLYDPGMERVKE